MQPGDLLLLKGSRGVRMEKILEAIDAQHRARPRTAAGQQRRNVAARGAAEMLYYLFFFVLRPHFSPLNVFRYITVRTAVASLTALLLSLLLGPWVIARLRELQVKQYIREEGPKAHQNKAGTPTMGGVLIVASIVIPTLLWADLRNPYVLLAVGATLAFGAIGFIDDYNKVVRKQNQGLTARGKFLLQVLTCVGVGGVLLGLQAKGAYSTQLSVPFLKTPASGSGDRFAARAPVHLAAGVRAVRSFSGAGDRGPFERRESHRRARRPGDRLRAGFARRR